MVGQLCIDFLFQLCILNSCIQAIGQLLSLHIQSSMWYTEMINFTVTIAPSSGSIMNQVPRLMIMLIIQVWALLYVYQLDEWLSKTAVVMISE